MGVLKGGIGCWMNVWVGDRLGIVLGCKEIGIYGELLVVGFNGSMVRVVFLVKVRCCVRVQESYWIMISGAGWVIECSGVSKRLR